MMRRIAKDGLLWEGVVALMSIARAGRPSDESMGAAGQQSVRLRSMPLTDPRVSLRKAPGRGNGEDCVATIGDWQRQGFDLHKHLWKLPIPEFDPNNTDHADLSNLGSRAAVEAEKVIAGLGDPVPSVTKARSVLRHEWQPNSAVARGIEVGVQGLLG